MHSLKKFSFVSYVESAENTKDIVIYTEPIK